MLPTPAQSLLAGPRRWSEMGFYQVFLSVETMGLEPTTPTVQGRQQLPISVTAPARGNVVVRPGNPRMGVSGIETTSRLRWASATRATVPPPIVAQAIVELGDTASALPHSA
jgi:hypothetical protein